VCVSKTECLGQQDLFNKELRCGEIVRELFRSVRKRARSTRRSCDNAACDLVVEGDTGNDNGRLKYWVSH
jgi:hypothetical protein